MNNRLGRVLDWARLAERAQYQAKELARLNEVSLRQLERFFDEYFGRAPQSWLDELRLLRSARLLVEGRSVKDVAWKLGFYDVPHFSKQFKQYHGCNPSRFLEIHQERLAERKRQYQDCFPGEEIPDEWLLDPHLLRPEEPLFGKPLHRTLRAMSARLT